MKNTKDLEYRMYGLVMYNISPIQQGIHYGHALQEYNNKAFDDDFLEGFEISAFNAWRVKWKTFIILNGGTSNQKYGGTMELHKNWLKEHGIKHATFNEPDLNDALSAIVFLVDERVFNFKDYPTFKDWLEDKFGTGFIKERKSHFKYSTIEKIFDSDYKEWVEFIGGEKNVALKQWIKGFRLA